MLSCACAHSLYAEYCRVLPQWIIPHGKGIMLAHTHVHLSPCVLQPAAIHRVKRGKEASHPLLDRLRTHSARPDLAVDFFSSLFCSLPTERMTASQALQHPYLLDCYQEMQ